MAIRFRHSLTILASGVAACFSPDAPTINEPAEQPEVTSTGGVLVKTVTRGQDLDADGYVVNVQVGTRSSPYQVTIGVNDSVLIKHADAGWAQQWVARLTGAETNCWQALPNRFELLLTANKVTRIEFAIECVPLRSFLVYDRVTPHWAGTVAFHGTLSERYVLRGDQFRLQYTSARFGFFEYLGRFTQSPTGVLLMYWGNSTHASSTATLRGDSLIVDYDDFMVHSDFEPGVFVRNAVSGGQ